MYLAEIEEDLTLFLRLAVRFWASNRHNPTTRGKAVKEAMDLHGNLGSYATRVAEALVSDLSEWEAPDEARLLDEMEICYTERELSFKLRDLIYARNEAWEANRDRALIDDLIDATHLYDSTKARKELLDFVTRFRSMAPFNAMLLQAQRPGLTHAATARDWIIRFNRRPKNTARPLVILRTMGPVDFVFDVTETEGDALPESAFSFPTFGEVPHTQWQNMLRQMPTSISITFVNDGDQRAGRIARYDWEKAVYEVWLNRNHPEATQFVTLAHELAHLFLGHLGGDKRLKISDRNDVSLAQRETEAEITAYVVASRIGVTPKSEQYLKQYLDGQVILDKSVVLRAANAVETALGISATQLSKHHPRLT